MHNNEKWQLYDQGGSPIPGGWWDAGLDNPELTGSDAIVGAAAVFLYRVNGGELEVLWQKRSERVRNPGKYDSSAAGHVNLGESAADAAIREAREEIGVELEAGDLNFVVSQMSSPNRVVWYYLVDWTGKEDEFRFDDGEVTELKWVPYRETEEFRKKYVKKSLAKNDVVFGAIDSWLRMRGVVQGTGRQ